VADFGDAEIRVRPVADPGASRKAGQQAADHVGDGFDGEARGGRMGGSFATGMVAGIAGGLASQLPAMVGGFAKELFGLAGSMEEIDRRAGVVFGDNLPRATDRIGEMNEALGLSKNQALGAAAGIQDILVPMGFARDAATDMSLELLELGGALAGNTGGTRTAEEAHAALTAALTGEREQLKAYGVVLNEETVTTRVAEMATRGLVYETEQQAKAAATLELVTEASTDAIDLWNNRAGTQAEATARTKARMQEAKGELARGLGPAMLAGTELAAGFAGTLAKGVTFLMEHKEAVLLLGAAYAGLKAGNALGGAIQSMQAAKAAHGSLTAAMRTGMTKAISPWGLAAAGLTVGVGLLVKAWKDAAAKRREFNKDAATVAQALTNEDGLVVSLAGSWDTLSDAQQTAADALAQYLETDSRFTDRNQGDDLTRLGLTYEDLAESIHGGEDALRDFIARGEASNEFTVGSEAAMERLLEAYRQGPNALEDFLGSMEAAGLGISGNTDLLKSYARELDVTIEGLRDQAVGQVAAAKAAGLYDDAQADALMATIRASESIEELTRISNTAAGVVDEHTVSTKEMELALADTEAKLATMNDTTDDSVDVLGDAEEQTDDTRSAVEKLGDEYGELTDMVDEARAAIDRMKGGQVALDDATLNLNASTDDLSAALDENGHTFDIGTEAGRENMEQARDTAGSIRDLELALIENGTAADEAKGFTDLYRDSLREQLIAAGLSEDAVDALIETYGEVPPEVDTAMYVDSQLATFAVRNYRAEIGRVPRSWTTTFTNRIMTIISPALDEDGRPRFQHGGRPPVGRDVIVGERGPEVMRFDAPGRIIPNHRLAAEGGGGGPIVGELHVNVSGSMDMTDPNAARDLAERLRDELVRLEAETR
jgi:hypothetical protein